MALEAQADHEADHDHEVDQDRIDHDQEDLEEEVTVDQTPVRGHDELPLCATVRTSTPKSPALVLLSS